MWAFETVFRRGQPAAIDIELGRLDERVDLNVDIIAVAAAVAIEPTVEIVSPASFSVHFLLFFFL